MADIPESIYIETELDLALSLTIGNKALHAYDFYTLCPIQVVASKGVIVIRPMSHQAESNTEQRDEQKNTHIKKIHMPG